MNPPTTQILKKFGTAAAFAAALPFSSLSAQEDPAPSVAANDVSSDGVIYLQQNWTNDDRLTYYYTSQGSAMLPRDMYVSLEQAGSEIVMVHSDAFATRYGLIPGIKDEKHNPDGFPVGLATYEIKNGPLKGEWTGLQCAACHNNQLEYKGKKIRIDGGNSQHMDLRGYAIGLRDAVKETLTNADKLARFKERIKKENPAFYTDDKILFLLVEFNQRLHYYCEKSTAGVYMHGPGRMDALTIINNVVIADALNVPENNYVTLAPTKPPFVWNAPQSAWVQWTGILNNALYRNAGESLGVLSRVDLVSPTPDTGLFDSTVNLTGQIAIENAMRKLAPPAWPADIFGKLDQEKVAKGKALVEKHCVTCHSVWPHRWSEERIAGKRFIENALNPVDQIGTDPAQFSTPTFNLNPASFTAVLAPYVDAPYTNQPVAPQGVLLQTAVVENVVKKSLEKLNFTEQELIDAYGYVSPNDPAPPIPAYKAAPLEGMWAAPPYLHNGSVPSMWDLLSPASERPKKFKIGREFDPIKLGIDTEHGGYEVDTSLLGSSNAGHSYEDKPLGNGVVGPYLNEEERWAIIEYMKSIPTEVNQTAPYGGPENPKLAWDDPDFIHVALKDGYFKWWVENQAHRYDKAKQQETAPTKPAEKATN